MACSKPSYNPNDRKDHEQNLEKLCIKCLGRSKGKLLDDKLKKLVEKWLYQDYFRDEKYLMKGCCDGCRLVLQSKGKFSYFALLFKTFLKMVAFLKVTAALVTEKSGEKLVLYLIMPC